MTDEDLAFFYEHQRDADAASIARVPSKDWPTFIEHWQARIRLGPSTRARTVLDGAAVAGYIVSWEDVDHRFLGYWLGRLHWGHGLATLALTEFLRGHERRRPVHAHVAVDNLRSIRVLEKCGFARERAAVQDAQGHDLFLYRFG